MPGRTLPPHKVAVAAVLAGDGAPGPLAQEIERRLSDRTLAAERDLVSNMERVIRVTAGSVNRSGPPSSAASNSCATACTSFSAPRA